MTGLTSREVLVAIESGGSGKKPIPPPPTASKAKQRSHPGKAMPSAVSDPQAGATADDEPIISEVRAGFYGKLPGYEDLDKLDPLLKKEFLTRVNYEKCLCGCENETLGFCLVNDPGCPVVKARVRKIYDEVLSKSPDKPNK